MIKDVKLHKIDYSILAVLSIIFLVFFLQNKTNPQAMFFSVVCFSTSYVIWGIFHHFRIKTLHIKIVLEYILVAILAIIVATTLLL